MKLTTEKLTSIIREVLSEGSDDFDMGAHVKQKRMDRMRRGEPDPRNIPAGDGSSAYADSPDNTRSVVVNLIKQAGGDAAMADAILAAVQKMKEDGMI